MPSILGELKRVWEREPNPRDAAMLWAAATMCFFGFLRMSKVVVPGQSMYDSPVHLSYGDVRVKVPPVRGGSLEVLQD